MQTLQFQPPNVTINPVITGETIDGYFEYEELHVHAGNTLTLLPGAELVRLDVPIVNPGHADGGIVVHGMLRAVRTAGQAPILLRSQNPTGIRGHLMAHETGVMELDGVEIRDMGRPTTAAFSATNPIARYACHFHLCGDAGYQSRVENCLIHDTVPRRYGITVHGTNGVTVRNNTIRNKSGSGIFFEDGTERDNLCEGNLIEDITGTSGIWSNLPPRADARGLFLEDGAFGGYGIASHGPLNRLRNNVARRVPVGYLYYQMFAPNREQAILEFSGNLAEQCFDGFQPWFVGNGDLGGLAAVGTSVIKNLTVRGCVNLGVFGYPCTNIVYDGCEFESPVDMADYVQANWKIQNSTFNNCYCRPSTLHRGDAAIENCEFSNNASLTLTTPWISSYRGDFITPRRTVLRAVRFTGGASLRMTYGLRDVSNAVVADEVLIYDHQGTAGQNFQVYYQEQAPNFVVPATTYNEDGTQRLVGSPTPGLTNQQAWTQHGVAIAGAVLPPSAVPASWTTGLVRPMP